MNVPNHEKKAFRDMTPEERAAIIEAKMRGEADRYFCDEWTKSDGCGLVFYGAYRTRPRQLVIPWGHIKEEYKWAAMDEDGTVFVAQEQPKSRTCGYWGCGSDCRSLVALNINTTGIDWRESLTPRPEGV